MPDTSPLTERRLRELVSWPAATHSEVRALVAEVRERRAADQRVRALTPCYSQIDGEDVVYVSSVRAALDGKDEQQ